MPYRIERQGKEFVTVSSDIGKVHGRFKSRKKALAQLRALYVHANPADEKKKMEAISLAQEYHVKEYEGNWCVCGVDGKPIKNGCHGKDKDAAMSHMQEMMKEMEMENYQLAVAMTNPVWLGCAVTNRPHIRLKEHPLTIVEVNGKKYIRVPMMKAGKYRHPQGDLDMTGKVLDAFIQNHEKDLADFEVVLDAKHQPEKGALGLFGKKHGGFVQREKGDKPLVADTNGDLLVAYAKPTGEDSVETIEQGRFQHASIEFHPDYRSNVEQTYLSDDLREIDNDDVQPGGPGSGKRKFGSGLKKVAKGGLKKYGKGPLIC